MAVALEVRVGDLVLELLAHTPVLLGAGQTAGTVAAGAFQALADGFHDLGIVIETDFHRTASFLSAVKGPQRGPFMY